jgi:hypothetical protein
VFRAWSDGQVEVTGGYWSEIYEGGQYCFRWREYPTCNGGTKWQQVSSPNQGYSAAADLDFNGKVDGADLGMVLANWGDAPRHDIPQSECPLNLVNPR